MGLRLLVALALHRFEVAGQASVLAVPASTRSANKPAGQTSCLGGVDWFSLVSSSNYMAKKCIELLEAAGPGAQYLQGVRRKGESLRGFHLSHAASLDKAYETELACKRLHAIG